MLEHKMLFRVKVKLFLL